jgi:hypothetical protein
MRESYREGVAHHPGPEPCEGGREAALEALDRSICRLGIELRNPAFRGPTSSGGTEGNNDAEKLMRENREARSRPQVVCGPGGEGDEP